MTDSDVAWRQLARRLRDRRVELGPHYKNLSEFSRATGINYKTLQRAEGGKPHPFGSNTLAALDAAYGYESGSIEAILNGGRPTLKESSSADPLTASETKPGTGHIKGWPLRPNEELSWEPQDPSLPGSPAIRYTYRWTSPEDPADYIESSKGMDPDRDPMEVAQLFREMLSSAHGDRILGDPEGVEQG